METRKELAARLESLGVTGTAAEAILRETGRERHEWRVERAVESARAAGRSLLGFDADEAVDADAALRIDAVAAFVCGLDGYGIGGADGVSGDATVRIAPFGQCGKGRKQATDGPAWSAAIAYAATRLGPVLHAGPFTADAIMVSSGRSHAIVEIPRIVAHGYGPWLLTFAREGLRVSLRLLAWFRPGGFADQGFPIHLCPQSGCTPTGWADLVNALASSVEEPAQATVSAA